MSNSDQVNIHHVAANGIEIEVAEAGSGPSVLLLHGFPHTWRVWSRVMAPLARHRRVTAADLRGLGGSTRARGGYDAENLSKDAESLLLAMGLESVDVVGLDAGTPPAVMLALRRPELVRRLVVLEATLPGLPGAERFLASGPPWWFGFHAVPDYAERVLTGHEGEYLDFFYRAGLSSELPPELRAAFVAAYSGTDSLRCAFKHYRAMPLSSDQFRSRVASGRLRVPALAVGAAPVGDALYRQLALFADDLRGELIPDCRHIIPLDRPAELLALLEDFLGLGHDVRHDLRTKGR